MYTLFAFSTVVTFSSAIRVCAWNVRVTACFFKLREQHLLEVNTAGEDSWSESEPPSTVHINIFSQLCTASACISMTLHSTRRGSSFLLTVTELQDSLPNS